MNDFPKLVQVARFENIRRQMREYGFNWREKDRGIYLFQHRNFQKDVPEQLHKVQTRRKRAYNNNQLRNCDEKEIAKKRNSSSVTLKHGDKETTAKVVAAAAATITAAAVGIQINPGFLQLLL
ncbi:unnamed protein product [Dimorphilus gyrociliatus]|nr:unnamed protein product [Dimorphilus gyrociliatus]